MKIKSTRILPARLAEDLSGDEVVKVLGKSRAWLSCVENQKILISEQMEERIVSLIMRIGALGRQVAVEKQRLAADLFLPHHAPSHHGLRKGSRRV